MSASLVCTIDNASDVFMMGAIAGAAAASLLILLVFVVSGWTRT